MKCQKFPANAERLEIFCLYSKDKLTNYYFISAFLWVSNKVETGHICPASFPKAQLSVSVFKKSIMFFFTFNFAPSNVLIQSEARRQIASNYKKGTIKGKNKDGLAASDAQNGRPLYACL